MLATQIKQSATLSHFITCMITVTTHNLYYKPPVYFIQYVIQYVMVDNDFVLT